MATYNFYMKSGNVIKLNNVASITITKNSVLGEGWLRSYEIKYTKDAKPQFWSIDLEQVEGITTDEVVKTDWLSFLRRNK